jgi:hypothetical protein
MTTYWPGTSVPKSTGNAFTDTELKLDQHIKDCGLRMTASHAAGDLADANQWRERMYIAIKSRSPEHQAKMTERIESAIWFQGDEALALGRGSVDA